MNTPSKIRPDAVLHNQSEELQTAIYEMTLPGPGYRTYDQILGHLATEHGIRVTQTPLRRWRKLYHLGQRKEAAEAAAQLTTESRGGEQHQETAEEVFALGQALLADEAIENSDVKAWTAVQKLRQKAVELAMANRRLALVEQEAAEVKAARKSAAEPLTEEEKCAISKAFSA